MIAHFQSRDITALLGANFAFLAGGNEFEHENCMYGNVSFRDTNLVTVKEDRAAGINIGTLKTLSSFGQRDFTRKTKLYDYKYSEYTQTGHLVINLCI